MCTGTSSWYTRWTVTTFGVDASTSATCGGVHLVFHTLARAILTPVVAY